jgi:hypothetical protein
MSISLNLYTAEIRNSPTHLPCEIYIDAMHDRALLGHGAETQNHNFIHSPNGH